jgi:hypothetical protein
LRQFLRTLGDQPAKRFQHRQAVVIERRPYADYAELSLPHAFFKRSGGSQPSTADTFNNEAGQLGFVERGLAGEYLPDLRRVDIDAANAVSEMRQTSRRDTADVA